VRRETNWIRAEGGVRYACVGVAKDRSGVDGPATGDADAATSRRLGLDGVKTVASAISTSSPSPSPDETEAEANCALLTGMTRIVVALEEAEEEEEARRGRFFDGVSGAKIPSSSSEADTVSENEKLTLRFTALLFVKEGVVVKFFTLVSRMADLVGEADRECDGVLVGVFDVDAAEASALAFFLRISLTAAHMDSFNSTHSSSIIFTRRLNALSETLCLSASGTCCTLESWGRRKVEEKKRC